MSAVRHYSQLSWAWPKLIEGRLKETNLGYPFWNENEIKIAYIIDYLTGKKVAIKVHVLVRLRPFQERLGPFPFFPAPK